jgi:hypothetical protein
MKYYLIAIVFYSAILSLGCEIVLEEDDCLFYDDYIPPTCLKNEILLSFNNVECVDGKQTAEIHMEECELRCLSFSFEDTPARCQYSCEGFDASQCNNPPRNECIDSNTIYRYNPNGYCLDGACQYQRETIECTKCTQQPGNDICLIGENS